jgi:membrane fusion protein, copper/silver efflux system
VTPAPDNRLVRAELVVGVGILAMVAALRCKSGDRPARPEAPGPTSTATSTGLPQPTPLPQVPGRKVLYQSTMNPAEVAEKPGKDSMGMEMVPVEVGEKSPGAPAVEGLAGVRIPFRKQQLIGVRTIVAKRAPFVRTLRTVGRVTADETRLHHVHTKVGGWIETLYADATGEKVLKGQPLLSLYSPELLATQEEYLVALRSRKAMKEGSLQGVLGGADDLVASARRRLLLYDLTPAQIQRIEETGEASRTVTLYAPITGHIIARKVSHGERIEPDTPLLDIADLSRIWVIASVYEYELPFVRAGQPATMTLAYIPGKIYRGRVALVYPVLEGTTRTAQVRLEFDNPDLALKPEMYAHVELESDLGDRLTVPESAVLSTGSRDIVFVAQGEGYFEPREVQVGLRLPDAVEILQGLAEGETVLASGNFFVDSESKLKAALQATTGARAVPQAPAAHPTPKAAAPRATPKPGVGAPDTPKVP